MLTIRIFWFIALRIRVVDARRFERTYRLYLQGLKSPSLIYLQELTQSCSITSQTNSFHRLHYVLFRGICGVRICLITKESGDLRITSPTTEATERSPVDAFPDLPKSYTLLHPAQFHFFSCPSCLLARKLMDELPYTKVWGCLT
jgi:hypothetical protein